MVCRQTQAEFGRYVEDEALAEEGLAKGHAESARDVDVALAGTQAKYYQAGRELYQYTAQELLNAVFESTDTPSNAELYTGLIKANWLSRDMAESEDRIAYAEDLADAHESHEYARALKSKTYQQARVSAQETRDNAHAALWADFAVLQAETYANQISSWSTSGATPWHVHAADTAAAFEDWAAVDQVESVTRQIDENEANRIYEHAVEDERKLLRSTRASDQADQAIYSQQQREAGYEWVVDENGDGSWVFASDPAERYQSSTVSTPTELTPDRASDPTWGEENLDEAAFAAEYNLNGAFGSRLGNGEGIEEIGLTEGNPGTMRGQGFDRENAFAVIGRSQNQANSNPVNVAWGGNLRNQNTNGGGNPTMMTEGSSVSTEREGAEPPEGDNGYRGQNSEETPTGQVPTPSVPSPPSEPSGTAIALDSTTSEGDSCDCDCEEETPVFEPAEELTWLDYVENVKPDVAEFLRDRNVVLERRRLYWVNFVVEDRVDENGNPYTAFIVDDNEGWVNDWFGGTSTYDIVSWIIADVERQDSYKKWQKEKYQQQGPQWEAPSPTSGMTPEELMAAAGAAEEDLNEAAWKRWNNEHFGPGGSADQLLLSVGGFAAGAAAANHKGFVRGQNRINLENHRLDASRGFDAAKNTYRVNPAPETPETGDLFERTFNTSEGTLGFLAEVEVQGGTLILRDVAIYGPRPLTGMLNDVLAARSKIIDEARAMGFQKLQITGTRVQGSSSANPGHCIDITIDLYK
ncbi:hypothetical protein [Rubinisphaera margarita]|uniref:hypothetical protein n=1 Tax=Rubinisphaera margarita TaxID=2909586 RepID=UPI001EE91393|nr:hypothetical protein [Rubinisphaera margarita]MCG6158092.1 hypothetical protein [Rubinisphaera margarita]